MARPAPETIKPSHRFLYKPVENCETEGCHMDVWLPENVKDLAAQNEIPLAIMIHGGAFTMGASSDVPYNQVEHYLKNGMAVVSLEYRMVPHVTQFDIRDDLLDAYHFIQQRLNGRLAEELGIENDLIKTQEVVLFGGSAGGTSVLCLAADIEKFNSENTSALPQVKAILCAYPLTDPNNHFAQPKEVWAEKAPEMFPDDWDLMKDFPTTGKVCTGYNFPVGRWDTCKDPRFLFARSAMATQTLNSFLYGCNPPYPPSVTALNLISRTFPPTFILAAMADELIPAEHSLLLYEKLQKHDVESCIAKVEGAGHGYVERPPADWPAGTDYWKDVIREAVDWAIAKVK
ncbi:hypothetical protein QFC19_003407 [Naganishia cerealis]|uniref:Uncharacterized protein n=1 Tax=Naganishia cerealis TaxID=610337 RepID=A0ACC2W425_9TREE|nr:hypothetical protein QFC19_003407 [Naganishia cerealis]